MCHCLSVYLCLYTYVAAALICVLSACAVHTHCTGYKSVDMLHASLLHALSPQHLWPHAIIFFSDL